MGRNSDGSAPARSTRTGRRLVPAFVGAVLSTLLLAASPAAAAPETSSEPEMRLHVTSTGMTLDGPGELELTELVPGTTERITALVTNDSDEEVRIGVGATDLTEEENGCTPPERTVDTTCTGEDGELGAALRLSAEPESGAAHSMPIRAALDRDVSLPPVAPGESMRVGVTLTVPAEVDNRIQSDQALFDLVWHATSAVGSADASVPVVSESGGSSDSSFLAITGSPVRTLLLGGLLAVGAGALALWFGRTRRGLVRSDK
ncbi:hypothetical protein DFQ14_103229 [Halopolyspora algeriensis]|uniref:LPXTG-motif cell wall-anchored protein n=1 Tax=Halopolyspora algeriensis TaxID=1500506 RepID=A0A368VTC6_9ACTN|nr:hypothetical protein [Halopolyspora algeriensis]RCW45262.1 hypothetical protein DFQ14_103229 [Halopolyspora algeriensis]TQM53019.1 hypothetical protein FHU43_2395 [Halopolyspora algeriensis]